MSNKELDRPIALEAIQNLMVTIVQLHEQLQEAHKADNEEECLSAASKLLWISEFIKIDALRDLVNNTPSFRPRLREVWNQILNDMEMLRREADEEEDE